MVGFLGAINAYGVSIVVDITSRTVTKIVAGGTGTATYSLNSDGTVRDHDGAVLETWKLAGAASDYEARATVTSGTLDTGTTGTWLNLGTTQSWSESSPVGFYDSCVITVDIRSAATGTIHASASIQIEADGL